jgi:hypothetical protein
MRPQAKTPFLLRRAAMDWINRSAIRSWSAPVLDGPEIAITNAEKTGNETTRRSKSRFHALPDAGERHGELAIGRRVPVRRSGIVLSGLRYR